MIIKSPLFTQFEHGFGTRSAPGSQAGMASLKQVHSAICLRAVEPVVVGEGDALISDRVVVSVRTADCLPVLLADRRRNIVAAVHAGWRGTAARIVQAALREMGSDPRDVIAAIGPGIGVCCYHVGEDVARQFGRETAGCVDLAAANDEQLRECGVERIDVIQACTFCDADQFHSFRRDKEKAGRMISFIRPGGIPAPCGL